MTLSWKRRQALAALGALGAGPLPLAAWAQAAGGYPARAVKLLVGAAPGGPSDFLARLYAEALGPQLGQSFVVDNKPGASGTLAADAAVKAAPDGHTLLISGPSAITAAPHLFPKLPYDAQDLQPLSMLGAGSFALVVHPSVPAKNVQELIALAKAKPGTLAFGSGGNGSSGHLCTELFSAMAGVKMLHAPYKGDGLAVNDLIAGQLQVMFTAPNVALPQVKGGRLRLLAVTTRERVPTLPDVPTVAEQGLADFEYLGWIIAFAHKAVPRPVADTLVAAWGKSRGAPQVRGKLEEMAMAAPDRLVAGEPLAQFVRAESQRLGKLIRDTGITA